MPDLNAWNREIIAEFRANAGQVGGRFAGRTVLILHNTGARSGLERLNPLAYQPVGDSFAIFASKAGGPTNPDWYHNLKANPNASVEVGAETIPVKARIASGEERERIWASQKEQYPNFAEYERLTTRQIPVIILERATP